MTHRILLAEDDLRLAGLVKDYLETSGEFAVTIESNGGKVSRQIESVRPDLLILDIGLPNKDGLTLCKELRTTYSGAILMLTARNADADHILGLDCGADDYVIKPVEPGILLARIRALLRRYHNESHGDPEQLQFGRLKISCHAKTASMNGSPLDLSSHEFELLLTLARHAGQVVSREFLFSTLYCRPYDGLDRTIDVRMSQLRKKVGDNADKPARIKTIWGRGYLFVTDAW